MREVLKSVCVVCILVAPLLIALATVYLGYTMKDGRSAALTAVLGTVGWLWAQYLTQPGGRMDLWK